MMEISKLSQEQLQEVLLDIFVKGQESRDINVTEIVADIKNQILSLLI